MSNNIKETDKNRIVELEKKNKELEKEISYLKKSKKNKDINILNDQFSEEINLENLKKDQ